MMDIDKVIKTINNCWSEYGNADGMIEEFKRSIEQMSRDIEFKKEKIKTLEQTIDIINHLKVYFGEDKNEV